MRALILGCALALGLSGCCKSNQTAGRCASDADCKSGAACIQGECAATGEPTPTLPSDCAQVEAEVECQLRDGRIGMCKDKRCLDLCPAGMSYTNLDTQCHRNCTPGCQSCQFDLCLDESTTAPAKDPSAAAAPPAVRTADAQRYLGYANPRFGFSLSYPDFYEARTDSDNGDGATFTAADGAHTLKIWGGNAISNGMDLYELTKTRVPKTDVSYADAQYYRILYQTNVAGKRMSVNESCFIDDSTVRCFSISYTATENDAYFRVIRRMTRELTKNMHDGTEGNRG